MPTRSKAENGSHLTLHQLRIVWTVAHAQTVSRALGVPVYLGDVIQATLLRVTIHIVSRREYWPYALGVREARRALWRR